MREAWEALKRGEAQRVGQIVPMDPEIKLANERAARQLAMAHADYSDAFPESAGWFMVSVREGDEAKVATALGAVGVDVWVPEYEEQFVRNPNRRGGRRRSQTKHNRLVVAFPGFISVRIVLTPEAWTAINSFDGVGGIVVGRGESWRGLSPKSLLKWALTAKTIQRIMGELDEIDDVEQININKFQPGVGVTVSTGPWQGCKGIIVDKRSRYLATWVLLDDWPMLKPVEMWVDDLEVEPLSDATTDNQPVASASR